ncbi:hypothetical protein OB13_06815 [Pontibacter sp. HJ8]
MMNLSIPAQRTLARLLYLVVSCGLLLSSMPGFGQSRVGIGGWQLHVPYTQGRAVADAGNKVYLAAEQGLFYYDKEFNNTQTITKADGLQEQRISTIGYDTETRTLVIAYANANIDLLQENRIRNISDILRRPIEGDKTIHHILIHNKMAYLSSGIGVVVLDLAKQEIKDTYTHLGTGGESVPVKNAAILGDSIYLVAGNGIRAAHRFNSNLKDFRSWRQQNTGLPQDVSVTTVASFQDKVYAGTAAHGLFVLQSGGWELVPLPVTTPIRKLKSSPDYLTGALDQGVLLVDKQNKGSIYTSPELLQPQEAVMDAQNKLWIADGQKGLVVSDLSGAASAFAPNGPASGNSFRVQSGNGIVYVLSGGYDESYQPQNRDNGYYSYQSGTWHNNSPMTAPNTSTVLRNFVDAVYNPQTGHVYMAIYGQGLLAWKGEAPPVLYNSTNSTLLSTQPAKDKTDQVRLTDVAVDRIGNVWVVNRHQVAGAPGLHVLRPDGEWQGFAIPTIVDNGNLERLVVDDNNYKWISISRSGNVRSGLVVYDEVQQQVRQLNVGAGTGNLPGGAVYSLTKDLNGDIWVGTTAGVAVYYNPAAVFSSQSYDARIPIIEGRPLLGGQVVRDIAVDGANRKWMATDNGLWLFGPDGDELLQHFTTQNSPLPSDKVLSIAIEHRTGEVFVVTDAGIASYRAGATITEGKPDCAQVYPNPVRPDFTGLIGVSGLPNNAHVRITDVNGTLVHKTRAAGGTLSWDGRGYNGKRVSAGVYLVLSADDEGKQTCISKIAVLE